MTFLSAPPKKILIINIFGIGDVLFTTPLVANLKQHYPDVSIGYVCNRRTEDILKRLPQIDRVFTYERDEFQAIYQKSKLGFLKKIKFFIQEIKKEQYDTVIDLSMNTFAGFFAWMAGIKNRIGFNYKNRGVFLNKKVLLEGYEGRHVVEYYLDFLKGLNIPVKEKKMVFPLSLEDEQWAQGFLRQKGLKEDALIIGMVPGGGASWGKDAEYKRWPAEKYAKLVDKLIEKFSVAIILMGSSNEQDLCQKVANLAQSFVHLACGETSITQFAALSARCALNIVNDGGPLHVAVAAGAKTLSIFGPVDERVYGPYPKRNHMVVTHNIACRPCYHRFRRASCTHISCLHEIEVVDVLGKVAEII